MRYKQVVIIGSSDTSDHLDTAMRIGKFVADNKWVLVSGGRTGIMEAASRGASEAGGIVVGITPSHQFDEANPYCTIVIPSGIGFARNSMNVLSGDIIVSLGGKSGTLSELAYAWQYDKPVICCSFTGGWSSRILRQPVDDRKSGNFYDARNLDEVYDILLNLLT
ncbi:MAG: TIGR00725 family protein [Spirochaetota bacterium]